MKKIIFVLLMAGLAGPLAAQEKYEGIVFMENEPWTTVLEKAKAGNKLIFMDCYTTWCGPCKGLSDNIFPQKEVGDFFNANFVNAKYDMEKGDGLMLYEKYKEHIPGFPSLLLINSEGEVVHKMAGYKEADALIGGMKAGMEGNSLFAVQAKYKAGARDLATVTAYANALSAAVMDEELKNVLNDYIASMSDFGELEKPEVWNLVGESIRDPYSPVFAYVIENIDRSLPYRAKFDRYKVESQLSSAISNEVRDIVKATQNITNADTLRMMREKGDLLKPMLAKNNVKRSPDLLAKLEMNDLMMEKKPVELFSELAIIRKTGLLKQESYFLIDCYAFVIDNVKSKKMVRAALDEVLEIQGPKKENPSPMSSNFYDVIARGYTKLGEKAKAAEAQAVFDEMSAASQAYYRELFKDFLKEKEE